MTDVRRERTGHGEDLDKGEPGKKDAHDVLAGLRAALAARGVPASGPHVGGKPEWDYLLLDGARAYAQLDVNGYWQVLIYAGWGRRARLIRMADPDGGDWPGDPV